MLVKEGCPLTYKGGTSLLLILGEKARRLSIDIDVLCPPVTDIEKYSGNANEVMSLKISATVSKEVTKIRRGNPEAYYY